MTDVTALGEVLIDFTPYGRSEAGRNLFEQNPGGAPANVLAALSKMGRKTAFIGKVGDDLHGVFLRKTLEDLGIDTSGMITDPAYFTTLAFVGLENGERSFSFARKPGADTQLRSDEIPERLLRETRIFHFGSLSLTDEPARQATLFAVKKAKENGALISYDPNYRAPLWPDEETAKRQMRSVVPYVDIMKISDEECALLTDEINPAAAAEQLLRQGVRCAFVTLGKDGALLKTKDLEVTEPGMSGEAVDTTGAGDSFWGGILYEFLAKNLSPDGIDRKTAQEMLRFANTVAGLCVQKRGAIPAMPTLEEVMRAMNA
ncbi:MAG: carbohydrate kinase [Lachnospiraceae bacterium]|jgi:fructokinase|nr:carbohydrate kinase [Lachnospiraceae bacterium]MCI1329013.1 carbohydrate kinase [Lachnospiraceae bacterium]